MKIGSHRYGPRYLDPVKDTNILNIRSVSVW